ncbi:MAG TPA: L-cystine transporter, partial [Clostridiaceae bacterium]|nr:L-cystine transporter [Clostridiaceae bacterium]
MDLFYIVIALIIFAVFAGLLVFLQKKQVSFTVRTLIALGLGIIFGSALQMAFGAEGSVTQGAARWFGIVGSGFTKSLQFLIVPLV